MYVLNELLMMPAVKVIVPAIKQSSLSPSAHSINIIDLRHVAEGAGVDRRATSLTLERGHGDDPLCAGN